jgi:hypothetical protein
MAKQVDPISIIGQPKHFVPNVLCPFCKQPTLGVIPVAYDEETSEPNRFQVTCMYSDCVLNFMTPVSWEFDSILKELFRGTEYDKSETT